MSAHVVALRTYLAVFATLMVLTAVTVWVAFFDLGLMSAVVALGIAAVKATLVVLYFMHVRYSPRLIGVTVAAGLFWLAILFALTMNDYLTRGW
jgi:cytochrome c oxidase subunit 4